MLQSTSHNMVFSNIFGTLKLVQHFTNFLKDLYKWHSQCFPCLLRAFEKCSKIWKHPLGGQRMCSNILDTLRLVQILLSFSNSLEITLPRILGPSQGFRKMLSFLKTTSQNHKGFFQHFWGHCSWFPILLIFSKILLKWQCQCFPWPSHGFYWLLGVQIVL